VGIDLELVQWVTRTAVDVVDKALTQYRQWRTSDVASEGEEAEASNLDGDGVAAVVNPNWYVTITHKRERPSAYRLALIKTSSASVSNVAVASGRSFTQLRFIGDTEWPGSFPTMEPVSFVILDPGLFGEFNPVIEIFWDDVTGERLHDSWTLPGRFGRLTN
jgi:hypothetical protein